MKKSATVLLLLAVIILQFQNCGKFRSLNDENIDASSGGETLDPFAEHPPSQLLAFKGPLQLAAPLKDPSLAVAYQWHRRLLGKSTFEAVPGGNAAILSLPSFEFTDQGDYKLIVTLSDGSALESRLASLKVQGQTNTCLLRDFPSFQQPLGTFTNYTITNYFDHDPVESQIRDYMNNTGLNAVTYDGHKGLDISLPNFKYQDQGINLVAVVPGVVEIVVNGNPDRNVAFDTNAQANYVVVRSPNGFVTSYVHLRNNSITVTVGQDVVAGTILGQVGSSGYSDGPHLHLESRDCSGQSIDIMKDLPNALPYPYMPATREMDFHARTTPITSVNQAKEVTGESLTVSAPGQTIYFAYQIANVPRGDVYRVDFVNPAGGVEFNIPYSATAGPRWFGQYTLFGNFFMNTPGNWRIRLYRNNALLSERTWAVN